MLRRTRVTPAQTETLFQWLFSGALLFVALRTLLVRPSTPDLTQTIFSEILSLSGVGLVFFTPRRFLEKHPLALTLAQAALVSVIYFLTGGTSGQAHFLLYIVIALSAIRLSLERGLIVATLIGLVFSTNLIFPSSAEILEKNLPILATDLLSYYAIVFVFHFFVTGQREAGLRRSREESLDQAQRLIDQQRILVQLSRDITDTSSLDEILKIVLATIRRSVPFRGGSISLLDAQNRLYIAASDPPADSQVLAIRLPVGEGISGWIAEHLLPFYSGDLDSEKRVTIPFRNIGGNALVKSFLGVPLVIGGKCTGVLQMESDLPDAFRPDDQRLFETIGVQVAGAIENARLSDERRELSRELQAVYETANELTSHFDLDFILEKFAERAAGLLKARYAAVATLDKNGQIENFVTAGITAQERQLLGAPPLGHGLLKHVFHGSTSFRVDEISKHPDSVGMPPNHPLMRTMVAAPLISRGETHGAIYVTERRDGEPFSADDEELLNMLTAGASAAVSNARLYKQLRKNIEQLYALHLIGQAISSSLSWEEVIGVFNRDAKRLCDAEAVVISQWDGAANRLVSVSREGEESVLGVRERFEVLQQLSEAARAGQPARMSLAGDGISQTRIYGSAIPLNVRAQVLGLAEVYSHSPSLIDSDSTSLLATLVSQLAVSMENGRLYNELQHREQQLRNFVVRLFQAQDDERRQMAYDIHDGLAQLIVSANMHLSNFASIRRDSPALAEPDLDKGLTRLQAALTEVRRVVSELRPSTLDDFGLVNTLRRHLEELAVEQGWELAFKENLGDLRLDPTLETGAFRIVQESLNNVRKHAGARRVEVALNMDGERLQIKVQDWGKGFDLDASRQLDGHFGLSGMAERARLLGGTFTVESHSGEGTTVEVELPGYLAVPVSKV